MEEDKSDNKTNLINLFKKEKYVVLFIYLAHYPSHAYNISKQFKNVNRSKLKDLGDSTKVSIMLSEMEKSNLVTLKKEGTKKTYSIKPEFLSEDYAFNSDEDLEISSSTSIKDYSNELYLKFFNMLKNHSIKDKNKSLAEFIQTFREINFFTILEYFQSIIGVIFEEIDKNGNKKVIPPCLKYFNVNEVINDKKEVISYDDLLDISASLDILEKELLFPEDLIKK